MMNAYPVVAIARDSEIAKNENYLEVLARFSLKILDLNRFKIIILILSIPKNKTKILT